MPDVRRGWFAFPWDFREAALFTLLLAATGFLLEFAGAGGGFTLPSWPYNGMVLLLLFAIIAATGLLFRNSRLVVWLGGIPVGLCLILALALLSFIGGVVPQQPLADGGLAVQLGFNRIFSSWPFVLVVLLFLINLGLSFIWKLVPFRVANLQFLFFHAGFWIALASGLLGTADLQRYIVPIREGQANAVGFRMGDNSVIELPFSVRLHDFALEEYPPQLLMYDPRNNDFMLDRSQAVIQVAEGVRGSWEGVEVEVVEFRRSAIPDSLGQPLPAAAGEGIEFARVRIAYGDEAGEAWLSTGGAAYRPSVVQIDNRLLIMVPGSPKAFRSEVTLSDGAGATAEAMLEVNKPVDFNGWKLYQMGYDEEAGRWSRLSLIEAIRDPWLPAVYLGFFLMMAGNVLYFWKGINRREAA